MHAYLAPPDLAPRAIEPGTRQAPVFGVGIGFIVFISIVLLLRMYVRIVIIRAVGSDDVLMIIGAFLAFGISIASIIAAWYGTGEHYDDIPPENLVPMQKAIWATRILYVTSMMFVKLSLLWFYLRLDHRRYMRWSVYGLMFVVFGLSVGSTFFTIFSCIPPSKFWDMTGTVKGHCSSAHSLQVYYDANGILNIVTDIFICFIPIPMLWKLHISRRKKIALFGIFGLGSFSVAAGCVRYDYVRMLSNTQDQFYYLADSLNWCGIEIYVAIFCGSAPSLSVLVKTYMPRAFGSSGAPEYSGSGQHHLQSISRRAKDGWTMSSNTRHRRLDDLELTNNSQDPIVSGRGIMMKTDIHLDVCDSQSNGDDTRQTGTYNQFKPR